MSMLQLQVLWMLLVKWKESWEDQGISDIWMGHGKYNKEIAVRPISDYKGRCLRSENSL